MKLARLLALTLAAFLTISCGGTPPTAKTVADDVKTGLEEAQRVCALTQSLLGVNEPKAVATACGIAEVAYPALESLLDEVGKASKAAAKIKSERAPAK